MPRKTKEQTDLENKDEPKKVATKKSKSTTSTAKKTTTKKTSTNKKDVSEDKETKPAKKRTTSSKAKKTSTTKKASSSTTKKATKRTTKTSTKKTTTRKSTSKKKKETVKIEPVEYYDLPYRYNQTVVKVLAQTPTTLFIYWDISDEDRKRFEEQYGENFFENTKPVLAVHNDTLGYSFEVEINDFANSWYLHIADSKCDYRIELGRRPIKKDEKLNTDYIYVTTSNEMEAPNDKILFNKEQKMVYFRNVKTGNITAKSVNNISFIRNMGKIYNIYDLYKEIYQNEDVEGIYDLKNPSSHPSS